MITVLAQSSDEGVDALALAVFGVVLAVTLGVTYWAAKRTSTASQFWAAGRGITGTQNGIAIAGDYLSAATFLGITGTIFLAGFDGWIIAIAAGVGFVPVLLLVAERMRNAGKYTIADVMSTRLSARPVRAALAITTLFISGLYLMAQMVGAGVLIEALTGVSFTVSVIATSTFMLIYVVFGGMLATTYVQIIKAILLITAGVVLTVFIFERFGFNPIDLFKGAAAQNPAGAAALSPGLTKEDLGGSLGVISLGVAFVLGTAGLPHILMRFFTVPDAQAARKSVLVAVVVVGGFFILTSFIGYGATAVLGQELGAMKAVEAVGEGGNLATPLLAQELGGGEGTTGGDLFLAIISAIAIATILAVVAGLVIASSAAITHDIYANLIRHGEDSEDDEPRVARIASIGIGVLAVLLAIVAGSGFNVAFLVGLAFSVAASTNFPCLVYAFFWRRFNTTGALACVGSGLAVATVLIILSPTVWPGAAADAPFAWSYPALLSVPAGFLGGFLGTVLSQGAPEEEDAYYEVLVRSETGIGSER